MDKPFEIERRFTVSPSRLWKAITDPAEMKQWYFDLPGFKAEVGYEFSFIGGPRDGIQYKHLCKITEVIPESKLTYSWSYEGYDGNSFVTFELFSEGDSTRLKFTHSGLESFPQANPDFAAKNFAEGWTGIVGKSLANFLVGN